MKIEKLNDKQIKVLLDKNDLEERDLQISELAYGSEKAQNLFKEMITVANEQFGFTLESGHIAVEATPLSIDSIVLVLTQLSDDSDDLSDRLSLLKGLKELFKHVAEQPPEVLDELEEAIDLNDLEETIPLNKNKQEPPKLAYIYKFKNLDTIFDLSSQITNYYEGNSQLFKYQKEYYLCLNPENTKNASYALNITGEFGERVQLSALAEDFFMEHGEIIVKENVFKTFSAI